LREHPWALLFILLIFVITAAIVVDIDDQDSPGVLSFLRSPDFVEQVSAGNQTVPTTVSQRIKDEAGIAAYCRTPSPLDLDRFDKHFNTIEVKTPEFVLGSMSVPNYPEIYDPHVYIHREGWVLAYYFATDPIAKIIDVKAQDIETTKLKTVVSMVLGIAGMPNTDVTYYHFQHPNATHMMFVAENYDSGDNHFTIILPSAYEYYERSWALAGFGARRHFTVNGVNQIQPASSTYRDGVDYGFIDVTDLLPNRTHRVTVENYGVLVLLYKPID
jgi:hypothetical protein